MGKIIIFEDRNFRGRSMEIMNDCPDMSSMMGRCQSIRVESGNFMIYDRPNFMGNQILVRRGDTADLRTMMGMSNGIRSCRSIPMHRGPFRMRIFERENFGGQQMEVMEDIENIMDRLRMSDVQSVQVMDGHFLMFEQPSFRGRMVYVMPGEHRSLREMGSISRINSIRRIMESMD